MLDIQTADYKNNLSLVQSMLDASMNGIMLLHPLRNAAGTIDDFIIEGANTSIEQQVGFTINSSTYPLLSSVFPNYKKDGFFEFYITTLLQGKVARKELYYNDGKVKGWFDLGVAPQGDNLVVTFVNITETKAYQEKLAHSASQFQAIMQIAQSGIFLFSPVVEEDEVVDFYFTHANPALASYVGQEPEALLNERGSKWFPGYKNNGLFEKYKETYVTGKTNRFEFHYDDDDIDVWLDILSTKLGSQVLVTFTDYTPVKKLQLQLETTINELQRTNASLEEFAYAASHDLQEPLRKINFYADRLKQQFQPGLQIEGLDMLNRMESASHRMRTLIEDLLAYSKLSAKLVQFNWIDVEDLINGVLNDLETAILEKRATIVIDPVAPVFGDKVQLQQLFQNIIGNALKYSRPGVPPEIRISYALLRGKEAPVAINPQDANQLFHHLNVTDNGLGFEPEDAGRIFKIFQRLHGRSEYAGTGIGLAMVQKVIENHKGYIVANGQPNDGATFTILLPA